MALKAKSREEELNLIRLKNKDNLDYPKLKMIDGNIEVTINKKTEILSKEDAIKKYKDIPYFLEELENLEKNDFITYNLNKIDSMLKSKYE